MKFLRHLAAVVLAVAVIVGLGMLWAHASGGTGIGSGPRRAPSREALLRLEQIKAGVIRVHSDNGFHLTDTGDLVSPACSRSSRRRAGGRQAHWAASPPPSWRS